MDGLQAGLEKLAMKPKVGWMDVQVSCQRSSNYQENTLNAFHKVCYCGVYFFTDLFIVLASENLLSKQGSSLKLNFWVSDIITPFGIHVCTTVTTQGSPLKLNETEIKEVKDMADSQSTAMRR